MKLGKRELVLTLILMILGLGCLPKSSSITSEDLAILVRPSSKPILMDKSPKPCPECKPINEQKMWKFTERDFLLVKEKLLEQEDYINYLLEILLN